MQLQLFDVDEKKSKRDFRSEYVWMLRVFLKSEEGSPRSFAGVVGVNDTTLYRWCKKHPEFRKVWISFEREQAKLFK